MTLERKAKAEQLYNRPWRRLWLSYAAFFALSACYFGFAVWIEAGAPFADTLNWPGRRLADGLISVFGQSSSVAASVLGLGFTRALVIGLVLAPLFFRWAARKRWDEGVPNLRAAIFVSFALGCASSLLQLVPLVAGRAAGQGALTLWALGSVVFVVASTVIGAPLIYMIAAKRRIAPVQTANAQRSRRRMLAAYLAVLLVPALAYGLSGGGMENSVAGFEILRIGAFVGAVLAFGQSTLWGALTGLTLTRLFMLAIVMAPAWWLVTRSKTWRRGTPDYWACVLTAAALYTVIALVQLVLVFGPRSNDANAAGIDASSSVELYLSVAVATLSIGALLGGGALYWILRVGRVKDQASVLLDLASLPDHDLGVAEVQNRELTIPIRVRERLDLVNAMVAGSYASVVFFLGIAFFVIIAFLVATIFGIGEAMTLTSGAQIFAVMIVLIIASVAIAAPLSLLTRIHRRILAGLGVLTCVGLMGLGVWRIARFAQTPAGDELEGVRLEAIWMLIASSGLMWPVLILLAGAFAGLAFASDADFEAGRGWRPAASHLISNGRRLLGMPTYLSALGKSQWLVSLVFLAATLSSAFWVAAPFGLASPIATPALQFSVLAAGEQEISMARAVCGQDRAAGIEALQRYDSTYPASAPLNACVRRMLEELNLSSQPLTAIVFVGVFAMLGLAIGRLGQRMATRAYQRVREWDTRAPIVFLRAFRADQSAVGAHPHGLLPRLAIRPAAAKTLDEIVLDAASPWGPVIAIGRPDEELPPLGAARVYAKGGDWRAIVTDLCDAASVVIICMDASEGVNWELQALIARGHQAKTLLLISPQLRVTDRFMLSSRIFPLGSYADTIAGYVEGQSFKALSSTKLSRAAYRISINLGLSHILGDSPTMRAEGHQKG